MEVYFRTRDDFQVIHEPFADSYWKGHDASEIAQNLKSHVAASHSPVFVKDIAHHVPKEILEDKELISTFRHLILVRSPLAAFHSHIKVNHEVKPHEFGYQALYETLVQIENMTGVSPYILLADELTENPSEAIQKLCMGLGLEHLPRALSWPAKEQKDWRAAQKWQAKAASSTGFEKPKDDSLDPVPLEYKEIFEAHRNYYLKMLARAQG